MPDDIEFSKKYIILSKKVNAHIENASNPHNVTKEQVGLGNVDNIAPKDLPVSEDTQKEIDRLDARIDEVEQHINTYSSLNKVRNYLYEINYNALNYEAAYKYFKNENHKTVFNLGLTFRNGDYIGRNINSTYDEYADFIVRTPAHADRYATIGLAARYEELTDSFVDKREYNEIYKYLPFNIVDGMNEEGLYVSVNLFSSVLDSKVTKKTTPFVEKRLDLSVSMVARYIVDYFSNALDAINFLRDYVSVYISPQLNDEKYDCEWFLTDKSKKVYVLKIVKESNTQYLGYKEITDSPVSTNFSRIGIILGTHSDPSSKKVYTPATKEIYLQTETYAEYFDAYTYNEIDLFGVGLEEYNFAIDYLSNLTEEGSKEATQNLLEALFFTQNYIRSPYEVSDYLFTDFDGVWNDTTLQVNSDPNLFVSIIENQTNNYHNRSRNSTSSYFGTKQTVHSCVYDLEKKKLFIKAQENNLKQYSFLVNDNFQSQIDTLNDNLNQEINRAIAAETVLENTKQNNLTAGDGIVLYNDVIQVDLSLMTNDELNDLFGLSNDSVIVENNELSLNNYTWIIENTTSINDPEVEVDDNTLNL